MAAKSIFPLLLAAGVGAALLTKKKPAKKKRKPIPEDYLNGYLAPGATVGAAEGLEKIEKEIFLENIVMRDNEGNMHKVDSATFYPPDPGREYGHFATSTVFPKGGNEFTGNPIANVVTNFYGPGAVAFEGEVMDEFIEGPIPADPKDVEAAPAVALAVLQRLRSKIDWSTVSKESAEGMVLGGATIISSIVQQQLPGA